MLNKENWQLWESFIDSGSPYLAFGCLELLSLTIIDGQVVAQSLDFNDPSTIEQPFPDRPSSPDIPLQTPSVPDLSPELPNIPDTITVEKFEFIGNTAISERELAEVTANFTNKPISFPQLIQAANQVTNLYLQKGYITSGAYLPSQELQSGVVKIQIIEGSLSQIDVEIVKGKLSPSPQPNKLASDNCTPRSKVPTLGLRLLLRLGVIVKVSAPVTSIFSRLVPGSIPAVNCAFKVSIKGLNCSSCRTSCNLLILRGLEAPIATRLRTYSGLNLAYLNTDGSDGFEGSYTVPINARNGTFSIAYTYSDNEIVEPPFDQLDIEVESQELDITFRQPIFQKATADNTQELALSLSATRENSDSRLLGIDFPLTAGADDDGETRISALRFSQEWLQRSNKAVLSARSQFSLGINAFDATINRDEPDSRFFFWRGQFVYSRLLASQSNNRIVNPTFLFRSDIQLSTTSLVAIEQFSLGGQNSVRGYRQDALLSDNGIFASAEIRLPIFEFPKTQSSLQVAPFVDFGAAWNSDRANPETNTLASLGVGLLWQTSDKFTARLDVGIPLVKLDSGDRTLQENGIYFQMQYRL